jgi:hypothetical protein
MVHTRLIIVREMFSPVFEYRIKPRNHKANKNSEQNIILGYLILVCLLSPSIGKSTQLRQELQRAIFNGESLSGDCGRSIAGLCRLFELPTTVAAVACLVNLDYYLDEYHFRPVVFSPHQPE